MPAGRPPRYKTPEEMQKAIDAYFARCENGRKVTIIKKGKPIDVMKPIPMTVAGLALALGFLSREALLKYSGKPEFVSVIARAKLRIQEDMASRGLTGESESKITSLILASDFGYSTRQDISVSGDTLEDTLRRLQEGEKRGT